MTCSTILDSYALLSEYFKQDIFCTRLSSQTSDAFPVFLLLLCSITTSGSEIAFFNQSLFGFLREK